MNSRTQVQAPYRTAPRRPAETGPTPADSLAEAAPGDVHNLREWPPLASDWLDAPAPLAPAAPAGPAPRRLLAPSRPTDAWRDVLLNTLIPVVGALAVAIGVLLLAGI
jgi:hypothetical protein